MRLPFSKPWHGLLNSFAAERLSEGVVYWFGIEVAKVAVVTTLIVPDAETNACVVGVIAECFLGTPIRIRGGTHHIPRS